MCVCNPDQLGEADPTVGVAVAREGSTREPASSTMAVCSARIASISGRSRRSRRSTMAVELQGSRDLTYIGAPIMYHGRAIGVVCGLFQCTQGSELEPVKAQQAQVGTHGGDHGSHGGNDQGGARAAWDAITEKRQSRGRDGSGHSV